MANFVQARYGEAGPRGFGGVCEACGRRYALPCSFAAECDGSHKSARRQGPPAGRLSLRIRRRVEGLREADDQTRDGEDRRESGSDSGVSEVWSESRAWGGICLYTMGHVVCLDTYN